MSPLLYALEVAEYLIDHRESCPAFSKKVEKCACDYGSKVSAIQRELATAYEVGYEAGVSEGLRQAERNEDVKDFKIDWNRNA